MNSDYDFMGRIKFDYRSRDSGLHVQESKKQTIVIPCPSSDTTGNTPSAPKLRHRTITTDAITITQTPSEPESSDSICKVEKTSSKSSHTCSSSGVSSGARTSKKASTHSNESHHKLELVISHDSNNSNSRFSNENTEEFRPKLSLNRNHLKLQYEDENGKSLSDDKCLSYSALKSHKLAKQPLGNHPDWDPTVGEKPEPKIDSILPRSRVLKNQPLRSRSSPDTQRRVRLKTLDLNPPKIVQQRLSNLYFDGHVVKFSRRELRSQMNYSRTANLESVQYCSRANLISEHLFSSRVNPRLPLGSRVSGTVARLPYREKSRNKSSDKRLRSLSTDIDQEDDLANLISEDTEVKDSSLITVQPHLHLASIHDQKAPLWSLKSSLYRRVDGLESNEINHSYYTKLSCFGSRGKIYANPRFLHYTSSCMSSNPEKCLRKNFSAIESKSQKFKSSTKHIIMSHVWNSQCPRFVQLLHKTVDSLKANEGGIEQVWLTANSLASPLFKSNTSEPYVYSNFKNIPPHRVKVRGHLFEFLGSPKSSFIPHCLCCHKLLELTSDYKFKKILACKPELASPIITRRHYKSVDCSLEKRSDSLDERKRTNSAHRASSMKKERPSDYIKPKNGLFFMRKAKSRELLDISRERSENLTSLEQNQAPLPDFEKLSLSDLDKVGMLGRGGYAKVRLVRLKQDKTRTYALKCVIKQKVIDANQRRHVKSERDIQMKCDFRFIVKLYRTFRDMKFVYFLTEACLGGELFTLMKQDGPLPAQSARFSVACIVEAVDYLHGIGIIHRDVKPENMLLDKLGYVKLADFGFAKELGPSERTKTFCGTPGYLAPEIILRREHDNAVDYWSLGILVFEVLTCKSPFRRHNDMSTYRMTLRGINCVEFPPQIDAVASHLIRNLCFDDPMKRLGSFAGAEEVRSHSWLNNFDWRGLREGKLRSPVKPNIKSPTDISNFDTISDTTENAPEEFSGWDADF